MASSSRERRRLRAVRAARDRRAPAIWHGALAQEHAADRPAVQHGTRGRSFTSWRLVSGLMSVGLVALLLMFMSADIFYVRSIAVGGLSTMTKEEIFALADIAEMHIFWVNPEQVAQNILRSPTVAGVEVVLGWPPNMVQIVVREREPQLVWEQAGVAGWIDLQGRVMRQRDDRPGLPRVIAEPQLTTPLGPNDTVPVGVVQGALQLVALIPDVPVLRYHPDYGLGFADPGGWEAWFGSGTDMPQKLLVYNALVANLQARGIQPGVINVVDHNHPYYSVLWGR